MSDSDTTKKQKLEAMNEIRDMANQLTEPILDKFYYQDLRHVRNSLRKAFREAGLL